MRASVLAVGALIVGALPQKASAGDLAYTCIIEAVYDLSDDGFLEKSGWDERFRDETFSVSRVTGEIIGGVVPTLLARSTHVLHPGDSEWSFRAMAVFRTNGYQLIQLIDVQEFLSGKIKPFVVSSMGGAGMVTGTCR